MGYKDPKKRREYQRLWVATRRAEFFAGKACNRCGSTDGLELDHVDPAMKVSHSIWSWSIERRAEEIAKCQVLCNGCHLKKTVNSRIPIEHDGLTEYFYRRGCRCEECKKAIREGKKRWRHKTGKR
jgi:hypothetical protein